MDRHYQSGHGGRGCPFCRIPPVEHDIQPGHLHWTWTCPNAPTGWKGVFTDKPVQPRELPTEGEGR